MLKPMTKLKDCNTCDYWYEKGDVKGCIFPNHAPIDSMFQCTCNTGDMHDIEIDEDHVQIRNIAEVTIL